MNEFRYHLYAQEIIFGSDSLSNLTEAIEVYGWHRLMLCTSPSLVKNGTVARLEKILGGCLVVSFTGVSAHVQAAQVAEVVKLAETHQIDAVIGLGGGSPIGMAKAVSRNLETKLLGVEIAPAYSPIEQPFVPSIAIPTTYAGSEMTPTVGVTYEIEDGSTRKITVRDHKVSPKLIVYDPKLTLDLPPSITASTGINGLAHCVEAIYSIKRNPLSTAAALQGIKTITQSLLRCFQNGNDLEARTEMMIGANLGGQCLSTVTMGIHHGTCHVLGGTGGVPHGVANSIILPHAIRFNLDTVAPLITQVGEAMGIEWDGKNDIEIGMQIAQYVHDLVGQMDLPQRLRDVGVLEDMLPMLAENMLRSKAVQENPKPVVSVDEALTLLRAAW